jgi:hypothetical protein
MDDNAVPDYVVLALERVRASSEFNMMDRIGVTNHLAGEDVLAAAWLIGDWDGGGGAPKREARERYMHAMNALTEYRRASTTTE